ncbi:hypothetical protein Pmani_015784 [Petrolisthes manimaculis]|uniref:Uncharacterized protein n=1 Tax=Petrolisthes manimaculis TaxID=1843537 RepID=A0AAE1UBN7_9EUCA|nr:hypothetical protein Pmani_015784 [Petrolisthes manimaculis]
MAGLITRALLLAVCILHLTRSLGPSQVDAQLASLNSLSMEDVETNILLNQLALLKLLNSPRHYKECTIIPPTRRPGPFPSLSYSTIQRGNNEMVEVDVEIIPPSQDEDVWYSHNFFLDHGTARDGWIYITNSKAKNDQVVFVCNGETDGTYGTQIVDWSIPTSVLTDPRHIIIQVQRSHVSLFEKTGDGLRHIGSRTCPRPFPSFPYFTVRTECYGPYCADLPKTSSRQTPSLDQFQSDSPDALEDVPITPPPLIFYPGSPVSGTCVWHLCLAIVSRARRTTCRRHSHTTIVSVTGSFFR